MNKKENKPALSGVERLIPELRFPEFKNEGEWEEKKISDLGETISGLTGKSGEDFGTGKPYVTYKQVFDHSIIDFDKCAKVQIGKNENQNSLQRGDILFTTSSETPNEVGFASVLIKSPKEEIYLNSFCFALRPFDIEKIQPQFSRYLFHSPIYRKSVTAIAQGSTRYNLSKGAFLELQVPLPKPQEQQKIASCLSSLDEVITAHSQKLDLLKEHKKGLMQNLFPQDGEKVPKFRFKEFEKDGEWVEKTLEEIAEVNPASSQLPDEFVYIDLESVENGVLLKRKIIQKEGSPSRAQRLLKNNDVIFQMVRPYQKNNYYFNRNDDLEYVASTGYAQLRAFESSMYLYQLIHTDKFVSKVSDKCTGSNYPAINSSDLSKITVQIPRLKEQQKIASCLSSLDALIKAQEEIIEQLKQHKKGLMQGLFPKIRE